MLGYTPVCLPGFLLPVMAAALCFAVSPLSECRADPAPSAVSVSTLDGKTIFPLRPNNGKASVIIYITTDCPIANALIPEVQRIYKHYREQGIQFLLVHVDPDMDPADAKKHALEYSITAPIVVDRKHQLVKAGKAKVTPQAAVFDSKGKLIYTGRINDQWVDYGKRRVKPSEHNLRDTLDALLSGKQVPKASTTAIGCYIPDLD